MAVSETTLQLRARRPDFPGELIHKNSFDLRSLPTPFKLKRDCHNCRRMRKTSRADPPRGPRSRIGANPRGSAAQIRLGPFSRWRFVPIMDCQRLKLIGRQGEDTTGYSSVGRASDCRALQKSDGPWFDSGWPDF